MAETLCKCGHSSLEHYRGECTMINERIMQFCPCKRFGRAAPPAATTGDVGEGDRDG